MADDYDLDPMELLNRRIAASFGGNSSESDDETITPEPQMDPEEFKKQEIAKMIAAGYVLAPTDAPNPQAPPARPPPLPPRQIIAPKEVFETKIEYDASHFWKDSRPDAPVAAAGPELLETIDFSGTQIESSYEIGLQLGSGTTSIVYAAKRKSDGLSVAIKVISKDTAPHLSQSAWEDTGKKIADCAGKNVVALIEEVKDSSLYLVLERLDGPFFKLAWKSHQEWSEKKAANVVGQILRAIRRIHKKGIIHGDVSPGNILSSGDLSEVCLAGFVKSTRGESSNDVPCSSYLKAPELIAKQPHGKKIDLWAIGCLTYLMLSGRWPFFDSNRLKQNLLIQEAKVDFSGKTWEAISDNAKDFIRQLLVVDPSKRSKASAALDHPWIKEPSDRQLSGILEAWAKTLDLK